MEAYLKTSLEKLKTKNYADLNLVVGNESCDLDSAVCAVVYAAFLNWQYDKIKCCKVCTRSNRDEETYKDSIYVPVVNVVREDYALKTEVAYCLRQAGIVDKDLVFRDDFDFEELVRSVPTKVTLVDHHVLAAKDHFLTQYVTEIIDHRPVDRTQWNYKEDTRTTIETVGSCSTLVAQRIKDLSALVASETDFFKDYPVCGDMLHSTIILDTVNFSKQVDKATPHDVEIIQFLESVLKPTDVLKNRIDATTLKDLDAAGCEAVAATWRQDDNTVFPVFVSATSGNGTPRFAKPSLQPGNRMTTPCCELSNTSGSATEFLFTDIGILANYIWTSIITVAKAGKALQRVCFIMITIL